MYWETHSDCLGHLWILIYLNLHPGDVLTGAQSGEMWKFHISLTDILNNRLPDMLNYMSTGENVLIVAQDKPQK